MAICLAGRASDGKPVSSLARPVKGRADLILGRVRGAQRERISPLALAPEQGKGYVPAKVPGLAGGQTFTFWWNRNMPTTPLGIPAGWENVLEKVQQHLDRSLAELTEREQRLGAAATDAPAQAAIVQEVVSLQERFATLESLAPQAQQALTELDQELAQREEEVRQFLSRLEESRGRLAEWAGRAIG